jgi:hypothetical protein
MHARHLIECLSGTWHPLVSINNVTERYFKCDITGPPLLVSELNPHPLLDVFYFFFYLKYFGIRIRYLKSKVPLYLLQIGDIVLGNRHSLILLEIFNFILP